MGNKIYPIGIQSFEKIRKDGYFYIDKTALVYQLAKTGCYYFLNRPRRFGKSLLISTLEAYFQGKQELFEGLAIDKLEKDWIKYPILHLDLNIGKYDTPESLNQILNDHLTHWEELYGSRPSEVSLALRFAGIIQRACEQTGQRTVILVDEYDKPMLQAIGNPELQENYRNALKPFYGALKSKDGYIKFAMLTGVTKFGKISVFSDLNNLDDISMREPYVDLCGISEEEIHANLETELHELAVAQKMTYEQACAKLEECYDGYHFVEDTIGIYNPFSLLNTFKYNKFSNYWFETGTPTYLVKLLKRHHYNLERMADVEEGFMRFLLPYYAKTTKVEAPFEIQKFVREVRIGDYDSFFRRLQSFFADTTYEIIREQELHYQNVLFIVFKLMGFYTKVEYRTCEGRRSVATN